jgi:hypothetical protein
MFQTTNFESRLSMTGVGEFNYLDFENIYNLEIKIYSGLFERSGI